MAARFTCQARILNQLYSTPVPYWTTKECEAETNKRISIDSGEAYMSICSCCFKRFIKRSMEKKWYGWFDCDYPPEAEVVGSKWFYENVKHVKLIKATPTVVAVNTFDPEAEASAKEPEPEPEAKEAEPEAKEAEAKEPVPEVEAALEQQMAKMTIQDNKEALRQRIKEIQARAKPVEQETKLIIKDKKEALKQRIKEIQARAKPGKMPMKEIQTAFKEITDLKTQIHML
jgi:hypothetical protein